MVTAGAADSPRSLPGRALPLSLAPNPVTPSRESQHSPPHRPQPAGPVYPNNYALFWKERKEKKGEGNLAETSRKISPVISFLP